MLFIIFCWNISQKNNNKEIISFLKEEYIEVQDNTMGEGVSNTICSSFVNDIIKCGSANNRVDSYCINSNNNQVTIGTFSLFDTRRRGAIYKRVKGLFVQTYVPYNLGDIIISNQQMYTLKKSSTSFIRKRFIPNYDNIPLTFVKSGSSNKILNDRIQRIISDFSAKNKNIGIVIRKSSIFISLYCKYNFRKEKSAGYYNSVSEAISELLNTLNEIIGEINNIEND